MGRRCGGCHKDIVAAADGSRCGGAAARSALRPVRLTGVASRARRQSPSRHSRQSPKAVSNTALTITAMPKSAASAWSPRARSAAQASAKKQSSKATRAASGSRRVDFGAAQTPQSTTAAPARASARNHRPDAVADLGAEGGEGDNGTELEDELEREVGRAQDHASMMADRPATTIGIGPSRERSIRG